MPMHCTPSSPTTTRRSSRMASEVDIELDGTTLEGGGQLLRNAVALSALTRSAVHICNVRQNREQPGLKAQHAAGLALVASICSASAHGIEKGSQHVSFLPTQGAIRTGHYEADPATAASTTLLLQISLPVLLFAQHQTDALEDAIAEADPLSTLSLRGGTNALNAPQADYALHVLVPFLATHILPRVPHTPRDRELRLDIKQRGFYPHGGGLLRATIPPLKRGTTLRSVELTDRGRLASVWGKLVVSGIIGQRVANEMRSAALLELVASSAEVAALPRHSPSAGVKIEIESNPAGKAGSSIILVARTSTGCVLAGSALGRKGVRAEETGKEAARELVKHLEEGGCVDRWMQDQMIIFLALAKGRSVVRTGKITLHTRTAIWVAERMTRARFEVKENIDGTEQCLIICEGVGMEGRL